MKKNKTGFLSIPYLLWMTAFTLIPLGVVAYYALTDPATGVFSLRNVRELSLYMPVLWRSIGYSLVSALLCLVQRIDRCAAFLCQPVLRVGNALLRQPAACQISVRHGKSRLEAPRHDRRQQGVRMVRKQDEQRLRRRFFQHFQQGVRGFGRHGFRRIDEYDAPPAAVGGNIDEIRQRADTVDSDFA